MGNPRPEEIITAENITTGFDDLFDDLQPPKGEGFDKLFEEPKDEEQSLAEFVGQETLGEAGLEDISVRGELAAADTRTEKITAFKKAYPEGDLVFVPGKGEAISTLEGVPSQKKHGEILFRKDKSEPYAKVDADFLSKGGNEVLADLYEFFADDIGAISGEILAGTQRFSKLIAPWANLIPVYGPAISRGLTSYSLLPLLIKVGIGAFAGEMAQEGVQEFKGINEQSIKDISSSAGFKSIIAMGGTAVLEPIVRRVANVFKGAGLLTRSDEAGQADLAVGQINKILKELNVRNKNGDLLQIDPLPANVLSEKSIITAMAKQAAAAGGPISRSYRQINEALAAALRDVGDADSAGKLIDLLNMATQFEKQRLMDLSYQAMNGSLKFDTLDKGTINYLVKQAGVKDLSELTMKDAAQIIKESMETITQPGGYLDTNIKQATDYLISLKPDGLNLDLSNVIQTGKKISFGVTQRKKTLNLDADALQDIILDSFNTDNLDFVDNLVNRKFNKLPEEQQTDDMLNQIRAKEYKNFLIQRMGADPLINIAATGNTLENISTALRDMDPKGGPVQIPSGIDETIGGNVEGSTLDFLLESRKQLSDILNGGASNVSREQKVWAKQLLESIDNTVRGAGNADAAWGQAFESLIDVSDAALSMRKLPIIQALANEGKYKELVKGYMDPKLAISDLATLKNTMDANAWDAFRAGFFNELVGSPGVKSIDDLLKLQDNLGAYDRKVLEFMFDRPTLTALDNLGGFLKKLDNSGIRKTLDDQAQVGAAVRQITGQKETRKIADAIDLIKNHSVEVDGKIVKGWDTPLGRSFHDAIKNELFNFSTFTQKGKLQLDLPKYRKFVDDLKAGGVWDTFSAKDKKLLENVDLVKDFIVEGGDVGASLEIADLAEKGRGLITGRTAWGQFAGQILELFGLGHIFTSAPGRYILTGKGVNQFTPASVSRVMSGVVATAAAPDDKEMKDLKVILDIGKGTYNVIAPKAWEIGTEGGGGAGTEMAPTPNVSFNQPRVNGASRLAQANIANPVGMRGEPTGGGIDPNVMAQGQALFNKPGEITFANQGGIMSTNKAFQRVA